VENISAPTKNQSRLPGCTSRVTYIHTYVYTYTGHTQKNGAVSKVNKNLCLTLHGHNIHRQRRQLSKFLMRYQNFASHAYCVAAGPVSKMALQQEKAFCVLGLVWLPCGCVSCDPGCTHWRIVVTKWETWTVAASVGVCCARVRWELHFVFTFDTAPFFCVCPV
jgi:hypothetical protein